MYIILVLVCEGGSGPWKDRNCFPILGLEPILFSLWPFIFLTGVSQFLCIVYVGGTASCVVRLNLY